MVIAWDRQSGVSRSIPRWVSPYARSDPTRTRTPILPRRVHDPRRRRTRYSGGDLRGRVQRQPKCPRAFLVVEDLNVATGPKILLDDRCAEVLDFDQAGPVEGAGG